MQSNVSLSLLPPPAPTHMLLSDHLPFMAKTSDSLSLMSWNILLQMRYNKSGGFYNNGFKCDNESMEKYLNRLNHIAANIAIFIKEQYPHFICLQECPFTPDETNYFFDLINKNKCIKDNYVIHYTEDVTTGFCLITLYNINSFIFSDNCKLLTDHVMGLTLNEGLAARMLALAFEKIESNEINFIINVHAKFDLTINNDIRKLYDEIVNFSKKKNLTVNNIVLLGDFNRNLVSKTDSYSKYDISDELGTDNVFMDIFHTNAIFDSSFCVKHNNGKWTQLIETRDGIMSTCHIDELFYLPSMNFINQKLCITHPISTDLQTIPHHFLERLTETDEELSSTCKN